jgi:hypothetical protein
MPVALHVAADDRSVEHVHRGEQGGRPVALVVVGHGSGATLLERQARLRAVERLDLAFFVDGKDDGVRGRIDVEPDDVAQSVNELGVFRQLELLDAMRLEPVGAPDALHGTDADADRVGHRHARPMRRLARRLLLVSATTRSAMAPSSFAMRAGRVLSRRSPSTPSAAKRSCQRQTQVLDLPVSRMIAFAPSPSTLSSTICARQTCFCGALRSLTKARSRSSSAGVTERQMPVRMP